MKQGFILLEVLLSTLIAGYASVLLFSTFNQISRATRSGEVLMDVSMRLTVASHQLTRDISGAWEPVRVQQERLKKEAERKKQAEQKKDEEKKQPQKKDEDECPTEPVAPEDKKQKMPTHIFYGTTRDGKLDTLTCITHNPLPIYWSKKAGKAVPHLVRVVYRLEPEQIKGQNKPSYKLMRQQDVALDYDSYSSKGGASSIRAYEVIGGIKDIKITYVAEIKREQKQEQPSKKMPVIEKEYTNYTDWDLEGQSEQQRGPIPYALKIELTVWDSYKKREKKMAFPIIIAPDYTVDQYAPEQEEEQPEEKKKEAKPQESSQEAKKLEAQKSGTQKPEEPKQEGQKQEAAKQ